MAKKKIDVAVDEELEAIAAQPVPEEPAATSPVPSSLGKVNLQWPASGGG